MKYIKLFVKITGVVLMCAVWPIGITIMFLQHNNPDEIGKAMATVIFFGGILFFIGSEK